MFIKNIKHEKKYIVIYNKFYKYKYILLHQYFTLITILYLSLNIA